MTRARIRLFLSHAGHWPAYFSADGRRVRKADLALGIRAGSAALVSQNSHGVFPHLPDSTAVGILGEGFNSPSHFLFSCDPSALQDAKGQFADVLQVISSVRSQSSTRRRPCFHVHQES